MIEMLRESPLFAALSDHQLNNLAEACTTKIYKAGTILFYENEQGTAFYLVISGAVKIYTSNASGEDKILSILSTGDSFGELSLLDGKPRSASAQAIEETKVITLTSSNFHSLLKQHFDINMQIMKQLGTRLRDSNRHVHDLTYLDAKQRVIKNLVKLSRTHGSRTGSLVRIKINLNYDELSQMASVSKQLLFEVFDELQMRGILRVSNHEFILDLYRIRA